MFWFFHPRPPSRREVAAQIVAREAKPPVNTNVIIIDAPIMHAPPSLQPSGNDAPAALGAIQFSVSYTWREYLRIVQEHVAYTLRQKRRKETRSAYLASAFAPPLAVALIAGMLQMAGLASTVVLSAAGIFVIVLLLMTLPVAMRFGVAVLALPMFMLKRRRMPVCDFTIDDEKIVRVTAAGTYTVTWQDVLTVHRYSQAYLLDFKRGGMPIPYRCLSGEQATCMRAILAKHGKPRRNIG